MYSYGFIGCGHMGGTLAAAIAGNSCKLALADPETEKINAMASVLGADVCTNKELAAESDVLVLGVKPQILDDVLSDISETIFARTTKPLVISMAAGVKIEKIAGFLGKDVPIIRIMPNTPAAVGQGMIVYSANNIVNQEQKNEFVRAFNAAGELAEIPENQINSACAISGCGPAFVYMFIEALAKAGSELGLSEELAVKLAEATVRGSGSLAMASEKEVAVLREEVCSPGGSTIEGVKVLQKSSFDECVASAVQASYNRTVQLG